VRDSIEAFAKKLLQGKKLMQTYIESTVWKSHVGGCASDSPKTSHGVEEMVCQRELELVLKPILREPLCDDAADAR